MGWGRGRASQVSGLLGREESRSGLGSRQARRVGGQVGGGRGVTGGERCVHPKSFVNSRFSAESPRHGGSLVLGRGQRLADWSHAPLDVPCGCRSGTGTGCGQGDAQQVSRAQQGPSPHPGHRFAAGPQGKSRRAGGGLGAVPCEGHDQESVSAHSTGPWCGYAYLMRI